MQPPLTGEQPTASPGRFAEPAGITAESALLVLGSKRGPNCAVRPWRPAPNDPLLRGNLQVCPDDLGALQGKVRVEAADNWQLLD